MCSISVSLVRKLAICTNANTHACIHISTQNTQARTPTYIHTYTHTYTNICIFTHKLAHLHMSTYIHTTNAHTHTPTYTQYELSPVMDALAFNADIPRSLATFQKTLGKVVEPMKPFK